MSIIKTAVPKATVEVSAFHKALFAAAETHRKSGQTMLQKMSALLTSKYGEHMPNFKQYGDDQAALAELAKAKGLADNQHVRKPYAAAVIALYGALPVSMVESAITKRAQRLEGLSAKARDTYQANLKRELERGKIPMEAESIAQHAIKSAKAEAAKPGAPAGEVKDQKPNQSETLEQWITRVGPVQVLDACAKILASDKSTKLQAQTCHSLADQLAKQLKPGKVA